jgi:hypothetical protein
MQQAEVLGDLFDKKILAILGVLVNCSDKEGLYLREIAKTAKVSNATTFRIVNKLVKLHLVAVVKIKKLKLYKFKHAPSSEFLVQMLKKDIRVLETFISLVKDFPGLQAVLLHGEESNERANLLLIGQDIDSGRVKEICGDIKEQYKFIISPLVLAAEQFDQMSKMGLYSGKEKVLFRR